MAEKQESTNERLYAFGNFYFSGVHAGIQTAHSVARMSQKYACPNIGMADYPEHIERAHETFTNWAKRGGGETIIVKNGGMAGDIENFIEFMESTEHNFPFDYFNESEYAANGATTNISMVIPEHIWKFADALRRNTYDDYFTVNTNGKLHYLVDSETYEPIRMTLEHETAMQHRSFEMNKLPLVNWSEVSKKYERPMKGHFVSPSDFVRELIVRMNRCGLM